MATIYQAIMCGGEGKRLWPLSRRSLPKYYVPLADGESLFQKAVRRALRTSAVSDILLITTDVNKHSALKQARAIIPTFPSENLIIRPEGKETFATLACALGVMVDRGASPDDVLICAPADHVIENAEGYQQTLRRAAAVANTALTVIGIPPTEPSSDFGYIEYDNTTTDSPFFFVKRFTEKPSRDRAREFIAQGNYLWNAGFYIGTFAVYIKEITEHHPEAALIIRGGTKEITSHFDSLPERSIDFELSEKSKQLLVVPARFDWNDYGDLEAFIAARGVTQTQVGFDSDNVTVCADGKMVVTVGISNLVIVDTRDALFVAKKDTLSGLSKVVNKLKESGLAAVDHHYTSYRPWGTLEIIDEAPGYNVRKITIDPGCGSSTQTHLKRSEHWVVVSGVAKVTLDGDERLLHPNESLYIPRQSKHRIENPMTEPLVLIEIQTGTQIEEDDIIRENDPYLNERITRLQQ
jgi:mannose-1-phosphate guanylyltransferase/mannose-6-phosphate isomerase